MSHFVFNITHDHTKLDVLKVMPNRLSAKLLVDNFNPTVSPRKDDLLLTLNEKVPQTYEEYMAQDGLFFFNHAGQITNEVNTKEIEPNEQDLKNFKRRNIKPTDYPQKYRHEIPVELSTIHENLEDYTYSLLSVVNYNNPYIHFQNKFTQLSEEDYKTIVDRNIFLSRTTFGRLFNALPKDDQFEVLSLFALAVGGTDIKSLGFLPAIKILREYIEEYILETGKYLVSIDRMASEKFAQYGLKPEELGFFDEEYPQSKAEDFVKEQAQCFQEFFELGYDLSILDTLQEQIQEHEQAEHRFNEIFNRKSWPIYLRI